MYVDEATASLTAFRESRTYYFCSSSCREEFTEPLRRLAQLRRELAVAWPLAILVAVATYLLPAPLGPWTAAASATVVVAYAGRGFFRGALDSIRSRVGNMDLLIAIGAGTSYLYSVAVLILPGRLPAALYFDAAALIVVLILTGNYLESLTRARSTSALRKLGELLPAQAHLVGADGVETSVEVGDLTTGAVVAIRPGERVPADGSIVGGRTTVDESLLTGESRPVDRAIGDRVLAGSMNHDGAIQVRVTGAGAETFLARVGELMGEAELSQVPLQRLADRIAAAFVPFVLALAAVAAAGWWAVGRVDITVAILVFVSVTITACPCAFGIATPAAIIVGTGRAAEEGVLFRGRDALEKTAATDLVLFDRTGTLTLGRPTVTGVVGRGGTVDVNFGLAAALESRSEHPYARALVAEARRRGLAVLLPAEFRALPGRGAEGSVSGRSVYVGRPRPEDVGPGGPWAAAFTSSSSSGRSVSAVVVDGVCELLVSFDDPPRPSAAEAVRTLREMGVETALVTGASAEVARRTASELGISFVHPEVSPSQKVEVLRAYQAKGRTVAFVGDGINDAPALLAADVGMAVASGADVTREAGRVLLTRSDPVSVATAVRLARATVAKVRQNLLWALGYNAVLLPIAAGALVPFLGLGVYEVLPITGALAMALSSTSVVLNSLSLRRAGRRPALGSGAKAPSPA